MAYMFVHDGLVHRRFPVGPIADVPYLRKVAAAHQVSTSYHAYIHAGPCTYDHSNYNITYNVFLNLDAHACMLEYY